MKWGLIRMRFKITFGKGVTIVLMASMIGMDRHHLYPQPTPQMMTVSLRLVLKMDKMSWI